MVCLTQEEPLWLRGQFAGCGEAGGGRSIKEAVAEAEIRGPEEGVRGADGLEDRLLEAGRGWVNHPTVLFVSKPLKSFRMFLQTGVRDEWVQGVQNGVSGDQGPVPQR